MCMNNSGARKHSARNCSCECCSLRRERNRDQTRERRLNPVVREQRRKRARELTQLRRLDPPERDQRSKAEKLAWARAHFDTNPVFRRIFGERL